MNEIATAGQLISAVVVLTLFLASPVMAVGCVQRWRRGEPLVAWSPRSRPQFGLAEIVATFLTYLALTMGARYVLVQWLELPTDGDMANITPDQFLLLVLANSFTVAGSCAALTLLISFRSGGSGSDLGLSLRHASQDILLGFQAFLLMAGFVYFLQMMLSQLFPEQHPLLELIRENPQPKYFLGAVVSAAVMAPIFEEVFFRAALQGWLEKHLLHGHGAEFATDMAPEAARSDDMNPFPAAPLSPAAREAPAHDSNSYRSPHEPEGTVTAESAEPGPFSWLAIVMSSLLFAAAHLGQGPAPIPLFFLALCLGYLYQRTHRLLPCITLHALLNSASISMLWLSVAT